MKSRDIGGDSGYLRINGVGPALVRNMDRPNEGLESRILQYK